MGASVFAAAGFAAGVSAFGASAFTVSLFAAGAAAGIRCAIDGQKVLLVEKGAFLGGTASRALVCPMMPTYVEHMDVLHRVEETLNRHGVTTRDGITTMI